MKTSPNDSPSPVHDLIRAAKALRDLRLAALLAARRAAAAAASVADRTRHHRGAGARRRAGSRRARAWRSAWPCCSPHSAALASPRALSG